MTTEPTPPQRPETPRGSAGGTFTDRLLGRVPLTGLLALAAPLLAIVFAGAVTSVILALTGNPPVESLGLMVEYAARPRSTVNILNEATTYYLAALAVAIGFRMNLFNIGVDGQYRLAALISAAVGGWLVLPGPLLIVVVIAVAMAVGAGWAAIAGVLKARRGVSEVISTIMLNAIATGLGSWLLSEHLSERVAGSNNIGTRPIPESAHIPGMSLVPGAPNKVFGFLIVAILMGVLYHVILNRTRFGFNLRATGQSESAAVTSGVDVKKMIVAAMVISGAMAGLVGMPQLLGETFSYSLDFPAGIGFIGISIALLGRNNPIGIAFGALLWSFLNNSSQILDLREIPQEIVIIMQGTIVLSVVIAYEVVHRYRMTAEQRRVSRQLAPTRPEGAGV